MTKPSPQLLFSAVVSALAMAMLALSGPTISSQTRSSHEGAPAAAGIELLSPPALPALFPR
ncbi:hypothetical protein N0B51_05740 [Tsuneonella sp. YG55]|uniref:Uncharacterized protein n=1 Tax=Tsuneonella litorea TaxID=2976475 RepID=A0A9X2VZY0_9SPHN|nr:hypothetical protein [Tsuneonella litorea]MCT2558477.1 hypothetical protein [Tsuneonella litorea]